MLHAAYVSTQPSISYHHQSLIQTEKILMIKNKIVHIKSQYMVKITLYFKTILDFVFVHMAE